MRKVGQWACTTSLGDDNLRLSLLWEREKIGSDIRDLIVLYGIRLQCVQRQNRREEYREDIRMLSVVLRQESPAVRERPALSTADSRACTKRGGYGDCFQPLRECADVNRLSTRRAGRSQGGGEGGSHQAGTSQALAEARTAPQGGRRAYVARRRCDPLRARLQKAVGGWPIDLPITLAC